MSDIADTAVAETEHGPSDGYVVVRMLLPLQEEVGTAGTVWRAYFSEVQFPRVAYIAGRARELEDADNDPFPVGWRNGEFFIRLHSGKSRSLVKVNLGRQGEFAASLWNTSLAEPWSRFLNRIPDEAVTWAEVIAVRKVTLSCNDCTNSAINLTTRGALVALQSLQKATTFAVFRVPSTLLTPESVQYAVLIQIARHATTGALVDKSEVYPVMPYRMMRRRHLEYEPPQEDRAGEIPHALRAIAGERIFSRHVELIAEATEAIYFRGQGSQGLMLAAQACEHVLDILLFFMMWWEGLTPKQGATEFESSSGIFGRVKGSYRKRLGSGWDPDDGILASWRDQVARPRNRVTHGGSVVSLGEAEESLEIARELRTVAATICGQEENASKYPPLRALLLGDEQLGDSARGMSESTFYDDPSHADERFRAWVAMLHGELALANLPSLERAQVLISPLRGGGFDWWLFDPDVHKVVEVDPASLSKKERRELAARNEHFLRDGIRRQYAKFGVSPVPSPRPGTVWRNAVAHGPGLPWGCPWTTDR
jgi:hypothetical protein